MADVKSQRGAKAARPLSPHLQVYRPLINMVMSILHRMTGAALYVGTLIVAWVLVAASIGPDYYNYVTGLLATWPGQIILFGYTWALFHHMLGGVRHFIWDTGHGYDLETIDRLSWGTGILSGLLTLGLWAFILTSGGPA